MPFIIFITISGNITNIKMFKKYKHTIYLIIIVVVFSSAIIFLVTKFSRYKLYKCLKDLDKERRETILKAHDEGTLSQEKVISIEKTTDRKRDECYELYAR